VFLGATAYHTLLWDKTFSPVTTYPASNASGATVDVKRYSIYEFGIIWCFQGDDYACRASIPSKTFEVKMGIEEAKSAKENTRYLVIGKLTDLVSKGRYIFEHIYHSSPEVTPGFDTTTVTRMLQFDALELWIYDGSTGKVYVKVKLPKML
jgi:hypothetical protein